MAEDELIRDPADDWRQALSGKKLTFQTCASCGHNWLPAREDCPECWTPDWRWTEAGGGATVISWVIYHVAFDPRFRDRTPYNVTLVELDEGPRLITNLTEMPEGDITGRRAQLVFEEDFDRQLPRFRLV